MAMVFAITGDLLFATKIVGTARTLGLSALSIGTSAALSTKLREHAIVLAFVDMDLPSDFACDAIQACHSQCGGCRVIAYYSHVRADLHETAHLAGADEILTRSQLTTRLPEILGEINGGGREPEGIN